MLEDDDNNRRCQPPEISTMAECRCATIAKNWDVRSVEGIRECGHRHRCGIPPLANYEGSEGALKRLHGGKWWRPGHQHIFAKF